MCQVVALRKVGVSGVAPLCTPLHASLTLTSVVQAVELSRPGVWISPDNLAFVYRVLAELCSINAKRHNAKTLKSS